MKWFLLISVCFFMFFSYAEGDTPVIERIPQSETSASPKLEYGQIFIEETRPSNRFPFNISIFGGQEIGSPYIDANFFGVEVKHRINSFLHLGLEYTVYDSEVNTAVLAIEEKMDRYGLKLTYPFLQSMSYINWHYSFFMSHVNLAGFFKLYMDIPLQFGMGLMSMGGGDTLFAVKWGGGPRVYLSGRVALKLLLSQTVSAGSARFLYTWYSLNFMYSL